MNFGAFAGGFAHGLDQGLARGKTIRDMLKEAKLQEQRDTAMAEAEKQRADSVAGLIKENGVAAQPVSAPVETAAPEVKEGPDIKVEPETKVELGAVPMPSVEVTNSPTRSPDAAAAATASDALAPAPKPVVAPSVSQAQSESGQPAKQPVFMVAPGSLATSGMVKVGNIDLNARPTVKNEDGSVSTVRSMSIGVDGKEVLIPTVVEGKVVSNEEAIAHFKKTGEHLGMFDSPEAANAYAEVLHKQQEQAYAPGGAAPAEAQSAAPAEETAAETEKRWYPNGIPEKRRSAPIPDVNIAPDATVERPQSSIVPTPAPAAAQSPAPTAAAPAAPLQAGGMPPRPVTAAPAPAPAAAAAAPVAAAMPGADVKPPVAIEGKFVVNGKGYATREAAYKAAEAEVPDVEYYYTKKMVPLMTKQLILEGNPEKALAWQKWGESQDGRQYMKDWHSTWIAAQVGDFEKAAKGVVKMFNKYENGQTLVGQETAKDKDGNITGFNVRIKNDSTGEVRSQFINPQQLVAMGVNGGSPDKAFELIYKKQSENDKIVLETKLKAQERKQKNEDENAKIDRKADRDDARETKKGQQRLSEITLKDQLGDEGAQKYQKAKSPEERANIMTGILNDKDPTFSRLPNEEKQKRILDEMRNADKAAAQFEAEKNGTASGPSTFKPAPAGPSAEPQLFRSKADGKVYRMVDGKPVLAAQPAAMPPAAAPAAPAAAPAPAPAAAGPATGMPVKPAAAAAAPAKPAAPVDPVMAQIQQQADPIIRSQHLQKYQTYQQITKSMAELSKSFAAAAQAGDDVQKQAISDNIAKLRVMADRAKADLSGFYRMPE